MYNIGELSPFKERPDSACGKSFIDSSGCIYHPGYLKKSKKWSCCGDVQNVSGCLNTQHKSADWPEEQAKLYFISKAVVVFNS